MKEARGLAFSVFAAIADVIVMVKRPATSGFITQTMLELLVKGAY